MSSFSAGHRRQRCRSLTPPQPAPALQTSGPKSSAGCSLHAAHSTLLTAAVTRRRLAGAACPHLVTAASVHPAVRYRITGDQQQAEDPRKPRAATPGASTRGTAPPVACRRACSAAQLCPAPCTRVGCSPSGASVPEVSQARILEWVAISSSGGFS